jgi:hypothetical protein
MRNGRGLPGSIALADPRFSKESGIMISTPKRRLQIPTSKEDLSQSRRARQGNL